MNSKFKKKKKIDIVLTTLFAFINLGHRDYIIPPTRTDSLLNDSSSISKVSSVMANLPSERVKVQVLTHNGSISSDSE